MIRLSTRALLALTFLMSFVRGASAQFEQAGRRFLVGIAAIIFFTGIPGCATFLNLEGWDGGGGRNEPFGGFCQYPRDIVSQSLEGEFGYASLNLLLFAVDGPLCLICDTLTLPHTLSTWYGKHPMERFPTSYWTRAQEETAREAWRAYRERDSKK